MQPAPTAAGILATATSVKNVQQGRCEVGKLTDRQKEDLIKAYSRGKNGWGGLKTGWTLSRKGFVDLSEIQLSDWTMWTITDQGIELAKTILKDEQAARAKHLQAVARFEKGISEGPP